MRNLFKRIIAVMLALFMTTSTTSIAGFVDAIPNLMNNLFIKAEASTFYEGDGTEANPYQVSTPEQLDAVRNNLSAHYIQTADIDMSDWGDWEPIGTAISSWSGAIGGANYNPPTVNNEYFEGVYDGGEFSIIGLNIENNSISVTEDCFGLFAGANNATIKNVVLENIQYNIDKTTTDYSYYWENQLCTFSISVGGISGISYSSDISNCTVGGNIDVINCSDAFVGGITGYGSDITECINEVNIYLDANKDSRYEKDSHVYCGGIVGQTETTNGNISNCANYGEIEVVAGNFGYIGGISGEYGNIENCVNFGNISGHIISGKHSSDFALDGNVGGIVGATNSDYTRYCVNYGVVKSTSVYGGSGAAGGIAGYCGQYRGNGYVYNCVNISSNVNSYTYDENDNMVNSYAGRIGYSHYNIYLRDNYSSEKTMVNNSLIGEPTSILDGQSCTSEQLLSEALYTNFDFEKIWMIDKNVGGAVLCLESVADNLEVEIVLECDTYNYINGVITDKTGKTVSSVNATVSVINNSLKHIENLKISLALTRPPLGGLSFKANTENYEAESILLADLNKKERKDIKVKMYPCGNTLSSVTKLNALISIDGNYLDRYITSDDIYLNYKINSNSEIYNFSNHQEFFVSNGEKDKYHISSKAMNIVSPIDKTDIYIMSLKNWNGSCYGMSSMLTSFEHGWSMTSDYGAASVKELNKPIDIIALRDAINIMQCSQATLRFIGNTFSSDYLSKQTTLRKKLVDDVKNISNGGNVPVLCIQESGFLGSSHAVVAFNVIESENEYKILIADPNCPSQSGNITISRDYSTFSYDLGPQYTEIRSVITDKNVLDINSYLTKPLRTSFVEEIYDFTVFTLSSFEEVTIENLNGQKAIISYKNRTINGDLEIYANTVAGAETGTVSIVIPDKGHQINEYRVTSSDGMNITINNNHTIADLKVENNATVYYSSEGVVRVTELNNSNYSLSISDGTTVDTTNVLLNTITGNNADIIEMEIIDESVKISSDNLLDSTLTVIKDDNNLTKESFKLEGDSVIIKSEKGNIIINPEVNDDIDKNIVGSGTCGKNVMWTLYDNGLLIISGTGKMDDGTNKMGHPLIGLSSELMQEVETLYIEEGVTRIGDYAFRSFENLKEIVVHDDIQSIGRSAFEDTAYSEDKNNWKNKALYLNNYLLCADIENITDTTYEISDGTVLIADAAFNALMFSCKFKNVIIPDSVIYLGSQVFNYCSSLTNISIGKGVKSIGVPFEWCCRNLERIDVDKENQFFCSDENGVIYNKSKTSLIKFPAACVTEYTIPDTVQEISNCAFGIRSGNTDIEKISIPGSVKVIGDYAFENCSNLTEITIPNGVINIGSGAFEGCTALTNMIIPDSVISIGIVAFRFCENLEYVHIPKSVTTIELDELWGSIVADTSAYICSDSEDCYAKTYASENNIYFKVCDNHGLECENPIEHNCTVLIQNPSITTISYGDAIILHADVTGTLPAGATIKWEASNSNFAMVVSADGTTCKISPSSKGDTTFTVSIIDANGNVISSDEQTMTSRAGFFDKIIAFFKKLFGLTKIIPQVFKGTI